jgi:hypothetical protein
MVAIPKHTNIVDAIRRRERRAKAKHPERAALVVGAAAQVTTDSRGRITVELATEDGGTVVYIATQTTGWKYEPVTKRLKRAAPVLAPLSPAAQLKAALDMTLNALVRVERAGEPKPTNIINISDIAAE